MSVLLRAYRSLVDKYPHKVQILTTGVLATTGDLATQMIEQRGKKHKTINPRRAAVMATLGLSVVGPLCSISLRYLHLYKFKPLSSIVFDQSITSPVILSAFVTLHPLLSGVNWENIKCNWWNSFREILLRAWMVWIPVQFCTFFIVPYQLRVLFIQTVALFWNMFLSYHANSTNADISGGKTAFQPSSHLHPTTMTTSSEQNFDE